MDHELYITIGLGTDQHGHQLRSGITTVLAETKLGPSPQLVTPESIPGKLPALTTDKLMELKFGQDVKVKFEGRDYQFSRLEKDGTFELQKDW